jgi:hypothetical protein
MDKMTIIWPVLAQILLTYIVYIVLAKRRNRAFKTSSVDPSVADTDATAWPINVIKASNNLTNQFEAPVLFYVLCLLFLTLDNVDILVLSLAWVFVVSRYVHALIHVTTNYVPFRFAAFVVGGLALIAMSILMACAIY